MRLRALIPVAALAGVLVAAPEGRGADADGVVGAPALDTLVPVEPGDVVVLEAREGRVVVEGVRGSDLEVEDRDRGSGVAVTRRGRRVVIRPRSADRELDRTLRLGVPDGVEVEISGQSLEVTARDLGGGLRVGVVEGDLRATGIEGDLDLQTVDGDIEIDDVGGSVHAHTVDGRVRMHDVRGPRASAQSLDGDLILDGVAAREVDATTVDGDVHYRGPLARGSRVRIVTHDGDVVAIVPPEAEADVEVATFDGEFVPGFPVQVGRVQAGQPLRFRMGSGGAQLDIQVFDGDIQLRHGPGR